MAEKMEIDSRSWRGLERVARAYANTLVTIAATRWKDSSHAQTEARVHHELRVVGSAAASLHNVPHSPGVFLNYAIGRASSTSLCACWFGWLRFK